MSSFPTHVTPDQLKAAAEILGLPARSVSSFTATASRGVTVTYFERNEAGCIKVGEDGEAVVGQLTIPIGPDTP